MIHGHRPKVLFLDSLNSLESLKRRACNKMVCIWVCINKFFETILKVARNYTANKLVGGN